MPLEFLIEESVFDFLSIDENLHVLQEYHKPVRLEHPVFTEDGSLDVMQGRVRLCPYFFVQGDDVELTGILATICPADKKIIHGMKDAILLPCRVGNS